MVHVTEIVGGKGGLYPLAADDDDIKRKIQEQADKLRAEGVKAEVVLESVHLGGPAHVIAEVAESIDADLIVVGARGKSPLECARSRQRSDLHRCVQWSHTRPVVTCNWPLGA